MVESGGMNHGVKAARLHTRVTSILAVLPLTSYVMRLGCACVSGFYGNDLRAPESLPASTWAHLAFVYDMHAQCQRIFVNSRLVASRKARPLTCGAEVEAGWWHDRSSSRTFGGYFSAGEVVGAALGAKDLALVQASSEESAKAGKASAEAAEKERLAKVYAAGAQERANATRVRFHGGSGDGATEKLPGARVLVVGKSFTVHCWVYPEYDHGGDHTIVGQMGQGLHLMLRQKHPYMGE